MKKLLRAQTALLLVLAMLLVACGSSSSGSSSGSSSSGSGSSSSGSGSSSSGSGSEASSAEAESGGIDQSIIFALHSIPDSIDPNVTLETYASPILVNTFEGLVTYDAENNIIPGNAESWEVSDDGLVYTFHLRDGLKWSDGSALTAADYVYGWLRVIDAATGSMSSDLMLPYIVNAQEYFAGNVSADEVGLKALDDTTLEVTLNSPTPYFLGLCGMYTYSPVQQATVEANGDQWTLNADSFVSNGPFYVKEINFNESYVMAKNPNYWNADNVKLENLTFVFIPESTTALTAFETGEIDGFWEVPSDSLPTLKAESDELVTVNAYGTTFHIFNCAVEPFDNPLVRKAFNLAIDRETLIYDVLGTDDTPALGLVAPGYVVDGVEVTEGRSDYGLSTKADPEAAQAALAEAGYPNGEGFPVVTYYYSTNDTYKKTVEALVEMLETNLNITMEIKTTDWAVMYSDIQAGDFQIAQYGWGGDYQHPMTFLPLFVTGAVDNYSNYSNPEYDAYVAEIQTAVDESHTGELVKAAEAVLMGEDYALLPLFYRSYSYMMSRNTEGVFRTPLNNLYFKDASVIG